MTNYFTYSLLQYRYSAALQESLNIGLVFHFPSEGKFHFVAGDINRIKTIYPNFDRSLISQYIKQIEKGIEKPNNLFENLSEPSIFREYLQLNLLRRDDTALQFTEPTKVINTYSTTSEAVSAYSKLLLLNVTSKEQSPVRKNEQYVIRSFTQLVSKINKEAEQKLKQPHTLKAESGFPLNFDYSWQNGTLNLIKPLSFDVVDQNTIIDKTEKFIGIFNIFGKKAKQNNQRLDILIIPPQNQQLFDVYQNALEELRRDYDDSKRLITENNFEEYAQETIEYLL